ncbi:MAG: SAV_6107 family HEPN domain-containing protein [Sciscionella sp.]
MSVLAPIPAVDRDGSDTRADVHPPTSASVTALLDQARNGLAEAEWEFDAAERFAKGYLAALRTAAAMLALGGRPHRGRSRPTSAWLLLAKVAPELAEWAAFFASISGTAAAVRAGITGKVTARDADDLTRQTGLFLSLVECAVRAGN